MVGVDVFVVAAVVFAVGLVIVNDIYALYFLQESLNNSCPKDCEKHTHV